MILLQTLIVLIIISIIVLIIIPIVIPIILIEKTIISIIIKIEFQQLYLVLKKWVSLLSPGSIHQDGQRSKTLLQRRSVWLLNRTYFRRISTLRR